MTTVDLPEVPTCACPVPVLSIEHPEIGSTCPNLVLVEGDLCGVCETFCRPWIPDD